MTDVNALFGLCYNRNEGSEKFNSIKIQVEKLSVTQPAIVLRYLAYNRQLQERKNPFIHQTINSDQVKIILRYFETIKMLDNCREELKSNK